MKNEKKDIKRNNANENRTVSEKKPAETAGKNLPVSVSQTKKVPVASRTPLPVLHTVETEQKTGFPYTIVILSLICSVLFMYMILNFVRINEQTTSISDLRSEISEMKSEQIKLSAELEKKNDVALIEKIAKEELGMVKLEDIERVYVELDSGDIVIVHPAE